MSPKQQDMFENSVALARVLKAQRRYGEAMDVLKRELTNSPNNLRAIASLADLCYRTARYREAMRLAGRILSQDPNDPRALVVMGNVFLARKKPREALESFRLAKQVAETDYLWTRIGRCQLELSKPREALEAVARTKASSSNNVELLRIRAEAARLLKDTAGEKKTFRLAASLAPQEPKGFADFVLPLLNDLPPRSAALVSKNLREKPGQETNPYLLLFESNAHLLSRHPGRALTKLEELLDQNPPEPIRKEAQRLKEKAQVFLQSPSVPTTTNGKS